LNPYGHNQLTDVTLDVFGRVGKQTQDPGRETRPSHSAEIGQRRFFGDTKSGDEAVGFRPKFGEQGGRTDPAAWLSFRVPCFQLRVSNRALSAMGRSTMLRRHG
jgi:hypothetical protein